MKTQTIHIMLLSTCFKCHLTYWDDWFIEVQLSLLSDYEIRRILARFFKCWHFDKWCHELDLHLYRIKGTIYESSSNFILEKQKMSCSWFLLPVFHFTSVSRLLLKMYPNRGINYKMKFVWFDSLHFDKTYSSIMLASVSCGNECWNTTAHGRNVSNFFAEIFTDMYEKPRRRPTSYARFVTKCFLDCIPVPDVYVDATCL